MDEYNVMVASADGNPLTQVTQIENYATLGAKFMYVMAVAAKAHPQHNGSSPGEGCSNFGGWSGEPGEDARDAVE